MREPARVRLRARQQAAQREFDRIPCGATNAAGTREYTHVDLWWLAFFNEGLFQPWVLDEEWEFDSAGCGPLDAPDVP